MLRVEDLKVHFPVRQGVLGRVTGAIKAVDGVSFNVRRGETLSLVGESGCGKSTTALTILRMNSATSGRIMFGGQDITSLSSQRMRPIRRRLQMIFQDPFGSLDPRMTIAQIIGEPLVVHGLARDRGIYKRRVAELLDVVGLLPAMADRYPHEFSGGQRQRVGIARALALEPELVICDEPVSALDVSIQSQILNLLVDLQDRLGLTYLFIAHDLSVVRHISDRIAVMYLGKIVEIGRAESVFRNPRHPYTQALLRAVPVPDPEAEAGREPPLIRGEAPSPRNPPDGCGFHTRCPRVMQHCAATPPGLAHAEADARVACHLYDRASSGGADEAGRDTTS